MEKKNKKVVKKPKTVKVVEQVTALAAPEKTQAEKTWDEIKGLRLDMFALQNQVVSTYYKPLYIDGVKLHLTALTKASAALAALEMAVSPKYIIDQVDRFVTVTASGK